MFEGVLDEAPKLFNTTPWRQTGDLKKS